MPRINGWIDSYLSFVKNKASDAPLVYHRWSAAAALAATLKRNCYVIMPKGGWKLYPTMYTLLVGRPGLGKGLAMNEVMDIVKDANVVNIISGKLTMPYVLDLLHKGFQSSLTPSPGGGINISPNTDHSALMHSSEISVFMNAYKDTIEVLTDLWDTLDKPFMTGSRQWSGKIIPNPSFNLLGGSAPEWLAKSIPADAVGGGFTRRVNFVYANRKESPSTRNGSGLSTARDALVRTLQQISHLRGAFNFSPSVVPLFEAYYNAAEPNEFDDAAASGYITSKPAHAAKLAMVHSVSRGDDLTINEVDWRNAVAMVEDAEEGMRKVFRAIGTSNFVIASDKILRYLEHKRANPSPTHQATRTELMKILWQDLNNSGELDMILGMLIEAGLVMQLQVGRHVVYENIPMVKTKGAKP